MALTKEKNIDKIEITENGIIQVRQVTKIIEDGNELSSTYHRWSFEPGSNVSAQPANVQAVAAAIWTEDVLSAFEAQKQADANRYTSE